MSNVIQMHTKQALTLTVKDDHNPGTTQEVLPIYVNDAAGARFAAVAKHSACSSVNELYHDEKTGWHLSKTSIAVFEGNLIAMLSSGKDVAIMDAEGTEVVKTFQPFMDQKILEWRWNEDQKPGYCEGRR